MTWPTKAGRTATLAFLALSLAAPMLARAQDEDDAATPVPTAPQRPLPPGVPPPDVLRKRLENLRNPGGMKVNTNVSRETPGASATPAAIATPAPSPQAQPTAGAGRPGVVAEPTPQKIGNGLIETNPKAVKPLPWDTKINLGQIDDTDLEEVIKTISRVTARNFLYDKKDIRNQKVTILMPTSLKVGELYQAFQTVLEGAGLTLQQVGPNLIKILPRRDAKEKPIDTTMGVDGLPWNDSFVTRIIRLQNIDVGQIQGVVQQLAAKDGLVQAFVPTNSLIITDTANNIRRLGKIIDDLDRSGGEENIEVIKIKYADVADVADKINQLFGTAGAAGTPGHPATPGARRPFAQKGAPGTPIPGAPAGSGVVDGSDSIPMITKVVADPRTNQLIIQANDRAILALQDFLAKIDIPQENGGANIHVYYLENADAEEMATVLANLASGNPGGGAGARGGANGGRPNPAPGFPQQPQQPSTSSSSAGGPVAVLQGDVKITSDKSTNALVITANKSDYESIKEVIKKLDIRRRQVYVEAVIMEMTVNRARDLGLSFGGGIDAGRGAIGYGGLNAGNALFPSLTQLATGFALGLIGPGGVDFSVPSPTGGAPTTIKIPPFGVVLNALETDSDINVLSRPNVLAKENEEAEVIVATSVAVPGNVTISQTGLQNFSITHEDIGITLKVTPKINESDHLSLNIFQEVKDIVNDQTVGNQRLVDTGKRSVKTSVVVKNGETIVIGGLLTDNDRRAETKIPILGDIPLLGWLFRSQKKSSTKQHLVIFLTPTIINDDGDMQKIYARRMAEREQFMKLYMNRSFAKEQRNKANLFQRYYGADEKKDSKNDRNNGPVPVFEPIKAAPTPTPAPWTDPAKTDATTPPPFGDATPTPTPKEPTAPDDAPPL